jgi:hypothetical protein
VTFLLRNADCIDPGQSALEKLLLRRSKRGLLFVNCNFLKPPGCITQSAHDQGYAATGEEAVADFKTTWGRSTA